MCITCILPLYTKKPKDKDTYISVHVYCYFALKKEKKKNLPFSFHKKNHQMPVLNCLGQSPPHIKDEENTVISVRPKHKERRGDNIFCTWHLLLCKSMLSDNYWALSYRNMLPYKRGFLFQIFFHGLRLAILAYGQSSHVVFLFSAVSRLVRV